ncbi:DUF1223 domain-containing protein [Phyllobacterium brassicacearum]|uniref:DUF1223 domain-containing protein n=1 Tax=Phyllobacterium brassicacearum TaxID=314235 RepID=A0A2P7AK33_9HYPH|nr:DUF1223 domain-containing protein [Phyllobacterium brassicacearum]PSH54564.1 DUF1223 domain-containing protein [Phyllobacterium brassicacearum]TDQ30555.1 hypothetical protein DEV91_108176 [Phyllobacterium brassicacearum]
MGVQRNRGGMHALALAAATALLGLGASAALAGDMKPLTVVELFTSQGCSSCPPANANLIEISKRPGVLALSFGVTYWDRLGWKDIFAKPEYTDRQVNYEKPLGRDGPFTPQVVVNGRADVVGNRISEIDDLIAEQGKVATPSLDLTKRKLTIGEGDVPGGKADIWFVTYDERTVNVPVNRGENTGRTLPHKNVVHSLTKVGSWNGRAETIDVPAATPGLRTAILIQAPNGGPILAAVTQ